jgi:hypothetical protein
LETHIPYFLLGPFNGITGPIADWIQTKGRSIGEGLDFTLDSSGVSFALTLLALVAAYLYAKKTLNSRQRSIWLWTSASIALFIPAFTAPFWLTTGYRLIYMLALPASFVATWVVLSSTCGKRASWAPATLLIIGNAIIGYTTVTTWNFTRLNLNYTHHFVNSVLERPEAKRCTSETPCCLKVANDTVARSAWSVNWNIGAPRSPAFIPAEQPNASCAFTFDVPG